MSLTGWERAVVMMLAAAKIMITIVLANAMVTVMVAMVVMLAIMFIMDGAGVVGWLRFWVVIVVLVQVEMVLQ